MVAYLNAANNARLRRAVRGETKLLPPTSKFNICLSCRERWFGESRKSWNLGLQSSDQVDRGTGTEEVKMYPRKVQTPSNSSYFDFRWKGNRWCSTYPTTLSPCSCLLYLLSCHRGATYWQIHDRDIPPITWFPLLVRLSTSSKNGQVRSRWSVSLPPWLIRKH